MLVLIWECLKPGETADSFEQPQRRCNLEGSGELCKDETCSFCNATREQDSQIIRGTLLVRTKTKINLKKKLKPILSKFEFNKVRHMHDYV